MTKIPTWKQEIALILNRNTLTDSEKLKRIGWYLEQYDGSRYGIHNIVSVAKKLTHKNDYASRYAAFITKGERKYWTNGRVILAVSAELNTDKYSNPYLDLDAVKHLEEGKSIENYVNSPADPAHYIKVSRDTVRKFCESEGINKTADGAERPYRITKGIWVNSFDFYQVSRLQKDIILTVGLACEGRIVKVLGDEYTAVLTIMNTKWLERYHPEEL